MELHAGSTAQCLHCQGPLHVRSKSKFCCRGCETVHQLLSDKNLCTYYDLRKNSDTAITLKGQTLDPRLYSFWDDVSEQHKIEFDPNSRTKQLRIFVEGIHCISCTWLLERLHEIEPKIFESRLNLTTRTLEVRCALDLKPSQVALLIATLGYPPHFIGWNQSGEAELQKENRKQLLRMGIAGACAGNIMMLSVADYAGATETQSFVFAVISAVLFVPVLFYCAEPFFRSAAASLRLRSPSVDVPLALVFAAGGAASYYQVFSGSHEHYFDSVASLIFMLLFSRWVMAELQRRALPSLALSDLFLPQSAQMLSESGEYKVVAASNIQPGATLKVASGDTCPADGVALDPAVLLNAVITGESAPTATNPGEPIYCGATNLGPTFRMRALTSSTDSRLGKTLQAAQEANAKESTIVAAADRYGRLFTWVILAASAGLLIYHTWNGQPTVGFERAIAVLIVSCPCALSFATPLTYALAIRRLSQRGIVVRRASALDKIRKIKTIAFDKTGTLTEGQPVLTDIEVLPPAPKDWQELVLALEANSHHPYARALRMAFESTEPEQNLEVKETPGFGVEAKWNSHLLQIVACEPNRVGESAAALMMDGQEAVRFHFADRLKIEAKGIISELSNQYRKICILSGDHISSVINIASDLGLKSTNCHASMTPEMKKDFVLADKHTLFVGDGANDMDALNAAMIGVSTRGSFEAALHSSDVTLTNPSLRDLLVFLKIGSEAHKTLHQNFGFTLVYNTAGILAAALGWVTPLFAAVLMPLSALSVFLNAWRNARRWKP